MECGHEKLLDPCGKALAVDGAIEHARRIDPVGAQRGHKSQRRPFAERSPADQLVPARAPTPDRRHVGLGPGLVDEDQTRWIKPPLIFPPLCTSSRDRWPLLLDGEQRFF
jgi:hypothetical protein